MRIFLKPSLCLVALVSATPANGLRGSAASSGKDSGSIHGRVLQEEVVGIFLIKDIDYGDEGGGDGDAGSDARPQETLNIMLESGLIYELSDVDPVWIEGESKGLKSGQTRISVDRGATISHGMMMLGGNSPHVVEDGGNGDYPNRKMKSLDEQLSEDSSSKAGNNQRHRLLNQMGSNVAPNPWTNGDKTLLVVRVIAGDGSAYGSTAEELRNYVFGSDGDPSNLKSQMEACSYGQLRFNEAWDRARTNPSEGTTDIENGVVTVAVSTLPSEGSDDMINAVTQVITNVFDRLPSQLATHAMYCLPPYTLNATQVAYAYINSWSSVYSDGACASMSTQMHEIGHNLGFGHSGEGSGEYDDDSGYMGHSYDVNDGPDMCYNGPKSFQSDWYMPATVVITPVEGANGARTCYSGPLYGISDYDGTASKPVVVKMNIAISTIDYYVSFNRQAGINWGTQEGGNKVMVTRAEGEGEGYGLSTLLRKLGEGDSFTIGNWEGQGKELVVHVDSIGGHAEIRIEYGGAACDATCNLKTLEVDIATDGYPTETSWTLIDTCTQEVVAAKVAGSYALATTAYQTEEYCVGSSAYEFTISDSYGDGMCCNYGNGSYQITYDGAIVASGGQYESSESKSWGSCGTPPPTNYPTPSPSNKPTAQPTVDQCNGKTLEVDIFTDKYPAETSWRLINTCTQAEVGRKDVGAYAIQYKGYQAEYCVDDAKYEFIIADSYGDGMCCGHGNGSYQITYDGAIVASGGQYESSESKSWGSCGGTPPTAQPTVQCNGKTLEVDITTDKYPTETSWNLIDSCTQEVVASKIAGSYTLPKTAQQTEQYCVDSSEYQFTIADSYGDGMCCNYGSGSYRITYDGAIAASGGQFGSLESKSWGSCGGTLPPTSNPTPPPTNEPTPQPTDAQCSLKTLQVDIRTDKYPTETSWTLIDTCTQAEVARKDIGSYTLLNTVYQTEEYCVDASAFRFIILDSYGDGMCCNWGSGSYQIVYDGNVVASGGQFASSESKSWGECI